MLLENELATSEVSFTTIKEIGADGKNSKVFKVRDEQLNIILAAKVLDGSEFENLDDYFREAQLLERARHPNVLPVRYAGREKDTGANTSDRNVYILTPFMESGSLEQLMDRIEGEGRLLSVRDVVRIGLQFLTGLAQLHLKEIVHFDAKPSNIFFDDTGMAVVADFGLARQLNPTAATQLRHYGAHRAPERYTYRRFTPEIDIYQAGLTLYRMVNGNAHFREQWQQFLSNGDIDDDKLQTALSSASFPDRDRFLPHVPNRLRTVIKTALAVDPDERYRTVREMMNDLGRVDQYLDWAIQYDHHGREYKATLYEPNRQHPRTRTIEAGQNGTIYDVKAFKTVSTRQRMRDWETSSLDNFDAALSHIQAQIRSTDT